MNSNDYIGQKYKFQIGKEIGSGGNGIVYEVKCLDGDIGECVIKIFNSSSESKHKEQRFERFKQEIQTVLNIQNQIDGIIKINDYYYDSNYSNNVLAWYVMERATQFDVRFQTSVKIKIKQFIELASIIKKLHSGSTWYAHRDIKPDNIFILRQEIKLSDFGLVWCNEYERLTRDGERLGPYRILPPELERVYPNMQEEIDYRKSDVYLFGKVLWMYLKSNLYGFYGEYNRRDRSIYLDDIENVYTLEPIHLLLEGATKHDFNERIDIDECINLLKIQLGIINNSISNAIIKKYKYDEETKCILNTMQPSTYIYTNISDIVRILNKIASLSDIYLEYQEQKQSITFQNGDIIIENNYIVLYGNIFDVSVKLFFHPKELLINEKLLYYTLLINNDDNNMLSDYSLLSFDIFNMQSESKINSSFKILFEKKENARGI